VKRRRGKEGKKKGKPSLRDIKVFPWKVSHDRIRIKRNRRIGGGGGGGKREGGGGGGFSSNISFDLLFAEFPSFKAPCPKEGKESEKGGGKKKRGSSGVEVDYDIFKILLRPFSTPDFSRRGGGKEEGGKRGKKSISNAEVPLY